MADNKKHPCFYCDGAGKLKKPNDVDEYEKRFDYYDSKSYPLTMGEAREQALKDVGYELIDCPHCGGTGIAQK